MLSFSLGFLLASLAQSGIVYLSEATGLSSLGARISVGQLLTHILVGQAAGFLLWLLLRQFGRISEGGTWLFGAVYGALLWWVVLTVASRQGTVSTPWAVGTSTVFSSLFAFVTYGILAAATITRATMVEND